MNDVSRQELLQQLVENVQGLYRGLLHKSDYHKEGLPFGQKAALFTIAIHKSINIKQLASILHVTSGAATQHVEALVEESLVERTTDSNDRRNVVVVLSPKGKILMKKLEQKRLLMMEELFSEITDEELTAYNQVMENVNSKMNQPMKGKND